MEGVFTAITCREEGPGRYRCRARLCPEHPLFAAHFPGHPILPGAVLLRLLGTFASAALGHPLRLVAAGQVKFTNPVRPAEEQWIEAELELRSTGEAWQASALVYEGATIVAKADQLGYQRI